MGRQADDLTTFKLAIDCWKSEGNVVIDAANDLIAYAARLRAERDGARAALEAAPHWDLDLDDGWCLNEWFGRYEDWHIGPRQAALKAEGTLNE